MDEAVVEAIDLRKRFDGHEVLRGVSFTAVRGETLVIMGGSGSGKTVTLRLVAGLIRPSAGTIRVFGERIDGLSEEALLPIRRRIGSSASSLSVSMRSPKTSTCPDVGRMSPAMQRSVTVLPEPLPPMITIVSPRSTSSETPRSTSLPSKRLCTSRSWAIGSPAAGAGRGRVRARVRGRITRRSSA